MNYRSSFPIYLITITMLVSCTTRKYQNSAAYCAQGDLLSCAEKGYYSYKLGREKEGQKLLVSTCRKGVKKACRWLINFDHKAYYKNFGK